MAVALAGSACCYPSPSQGLRGAGSPLGSSFLGLAPYPQPARWLDPSLSLGSGQAPLGSSSFFPSAREGSWAPLPSSLTGGMDLWSVGSGCLSPAASQGWQGAGDLPGSCWPSRGVESGWGNGGAPWGLCCAARGARRAADPRDMGEREQRVLLKKNKKKC